ncbi:MAG: hypothetical protein H6953_18905 [Chromatiaceae bacterium]|nr:hypothetical protein [Chromatiaceae bacterium]
MNAPVPGTPRSRAAAVFHIVLCTWLIGLSVLVFVSLQMTGSLAQQDQLDLAQRQQQLLETRLTALAENLQALQALPQAATVTVLQSTRESLEARLAAVEQAVSSLATADDVAALRTAVEQIKARQAAARTSTKALPRTARPAVTAPKAEPLPFRVIGAELRAGQRSILVAPLASSISGPLSADQLQPVLPGESVGAWRLEAIEGQTAVFRSGEQTRRLAIP